MKRIVSYILMSLIIVEALAPFWLVQKAFAVSESYDFTEPSEYTISDPNAAYIHWWAAKLKWTLEWHAELENGPSALDAATNVIYEGNIAYVASSGGHAISSFDVSDPANIKHLWYLWSTNDSRLYTVYDLQKKWDYLFTVSNSGDSMQVIDISDPANMIYVTRVGNNASRKLDGARWIDIVWDFAYIASYNDDALQVIDISNPTAPVARGFIQSNTRLNGAVGVKVIWDYAYVTGYLGDSVSAINISDPDNPIIVSSIWDDTITELDGPWGIEVVWDYAYVAGFIDDGFEIIDISNPNNITHVTEVQNSDPWVFLNGARELKIQWTLAYITASTDDSLEIIDISDPTNPTHVGALDTNSFGELDGVFGIDISWNTVLVTSNVNGTMFSIDVTDPTDPTFIGKIWSGPNRLAQANGILLDGNYAYVASYRSHGVSVIDISDISNPTQVAFVADVSTQNELIWSWDLEKKWDFLYVTSLSDSWLEIIDVSNPTNPIPVGRITDSPSVELQWVRWSDIQWDFLYTVSYNWDALQIFDISNPSTPVPLGNIKDSTLLNTANDIQVVGDYAYIAAYVRDSLVVVDISDPNNPTFVTELRDAAGLELNGIWDLDVSHDEQHLYIASLVDDAVVTIDISTPGAPVYTGDIDDDASTSTRLNGLRWIVYDEWYAYVSAYNDDAIVVVDVSDPTSPLYITELRDTTLYDTSTKITKRDNEIFVSQYLGSSFSILREIYPDTLPFITPNTPVLSNAMQSIIVTTWEFHEWRVHFQLSKDNGNTWYYYNGSNWVTTTSNSIANSNSAEEINTNIAWFNTLWGTGQIVWKALMESRGEEKVEIDEISIESLDLTAPVVGSSFPTENSLIPKHDFDIGFEYNDGTWVWVDTSTWTTDFSVNIAPDADITFTPTDFTSHAAPQSIVNGIIRTDGDYDYEYHSNGPNAFIEFNWESPQKIGDMKIYNRVWCCSERLTNATIRLYDDANTLLYTHTLWSTSWVNIIDIDFENLWEIHNVSTLRLDSVWPSSWINIREIEIFPIQESIELRRWDGTIFWDDIAHEYIDFSNSFFGTWSASYPTLDIPYGKYEMTLYLTDLNWNTSSNPVIFYIDEPEFIVSAPEVNIWALNNMSNNFSETLTITVKTLWAAFDVTMDRSSEFSQWIEDIPSITWGIWYGYQDTPFTNTIKEISPWEVLANEAASINTNGEKNTYTYDIQIWALIDMQQAWWDYIWNLDFSINLEY